MAIYKLKLIEKKEVATRTIVFTFEKPAGFFFKPGQYGGFTLLHPAQTDAGGITRRFSLLSAPHDTNMSVVTRIQASTFKQALNQLALGDEIKFAGPTGFFTLHADLSTPAVLIAGGIGIAPFYSMIRDEINQQTKRPLILFYGNQSKDDAAFLSECFELEKIYPHFKLIATLDKPDKNWLGETGLITRTIIKKYLSDIHKPFYYICGSPVMVTTLQETLAEMGINEDRIKVEDFPGY